MNKTVIYAKRAAAGMFLAQFFGSVFDISPLSPMSGATGEVRLFGAALLAVMMAALAAGVGAIVGTLSSSEPRTHSENIHQPSSSKIDAENQLRQAALRPDESAKPYIPSGLSAENIRLTDGKIQEDEHLWELALLESEGSSRRPGLWARCFAEAGGVDSAAKAAYIAKRVAELQQVRDAESARRLRENESKVEEARLAALSAEERIRAALPKGKCPHCEKTILLSAQECQHCGALFAEGATWRPIPLGDR